MGDLSKIREHMEVVGADGAHVGTVDRVEGDRIKLTKADSGEGAHKGHHHFVPKRSSPTSKGARCASPRMRTSP